eukprot:741055_1
MTMNGMADIESNTGPPALVSPESTEHENTSSLPDAQKFPTQPAEHVKIRTGSVDLSSGNNRDSQSRTQSLALGASDKPEDNPLLNTSEDLSETTEVSSSSDNIESNYISMGNQHDSMIISPMNQSGGGAVNPANIPVENPAENPATFPRPISEEVESDSSDSSSEESDEGGDGKQLSVIAKFLRNVIQQATPALELQRKSEEKTPPSPVISGTLIETDAELESLSPLEKFDHYVRSKIPLQRLVYTKQLAHIARHARLESALNFLLPLLSMVATDSEVVIRQSLAEGLGQFCAFLVEEDTAAGGVPNQRGPPYDAVLETVLPIIKDLLIDSSEDVRQASSTALVAIAGLLDNEDVGKHVLTMVLCMAHEDNEQHRTTAVPLMNELAPILGTDICRLFLAQEIVALSEDPSFRVKKATAQNFGNICKIVGESYSMERLLPAFSNLSKDIIWSVRKGCVESLVAVSQSISVEKRVEVLLPIFESFAKDVSRWVRNGAYEALGPFVHTIPQEHLTPEFIKYYTDIPDLSSSIVDSDVTYYCAYNFSAVVLTLGPDRWTELFGAYSRLVADKKFKVRKTLAYSLHEIARIIGSALTEECLLTAFDVFLTDLSEVREGVVKSMCKFLNVLSPEVRATYLNTVWDLSMESDQNWQFRWLLAEQLEELVGMYNMETTISTVYPLIFNLCEDRFTCIRETSVRSLGSLINRLKGSPEADRSRETLIKRLLDFRSHRNHQRRHLFVCICKHLLGSIPPELFKERFLPPLLSLASDPVINVRLSLARNTRDRLTCHEHTSDLPEVQETVRILKADQCHDVRQFLLSEDELRIQETEEPQQTASDIEKEVEFLMSDDVSPNQSAESPKNVAMDTSSDSSDVMETTPQSSTGSGTVDALHSCTDSGGSVAMCDSNMSTDIRADSVPSSSPEEAKSFSTAPDNTTSDERPDITMSCDSAAKTENEIESALNVHTDQSTHSEEISEDQIPMQEYISSGESNIDSDEKSAIDSDLLCD